jgi:hypothetical protein
MVFTIRAAKALTLDETASRWDKSLVFARNTGVPILTMDWFMKGLSFFFCSYRFVDSLH